MGEKKTTPITINGVEHNFEDMTDQQKGMVNHIADLDRKIGSTQFNLDQLMVGKDALDRKSTRLNSSHVSESRMPSSA